MKKIISLLLCLLFLAGCSIIPDEAPVNDSDRICAVWIYYSEISMEDFEGGTEKQFREKTEKMFRKCADMGINTVFYHVRPYCDAFYKSDLFPWSAYLTGKQGKAVKYDPLKIVIETAHSMGLSLHAWINPFRISSNTDVSRLSDDNPAIKWIKSGSPDVVKLDNGYYFSPASPDAQKLIIDGVREIVEKYEVDGVHIDDYFYPSTDKSVDGVYYKKYKESGGELSLKKWRLDTVSAFVSGMYAAAKSRNGSCIFSISPQGNIINNYDEQFADVKLWLSKRGYADWIIPQLYYGFENEKLSFSLACNMWSALERCSDVKIIYGIGAYKINESDSEWNSGSGIIDKQLDLILSKENCYGAAFFSYSSLADKNRQAEYKHLKEKLFPDASSEQE